MELYFVCFFFFVNRAQMLLKLIATLYLLQIVLLISFIFQILELTLLKQFNIWLKLSDISNKRKKKTHNDDCEKGNVMTTHNAIVVHK